MIGYSCSKVRKCWILPPQRRWDCIRKSSNTKGVNCKVCWTQWGFQTINRHVYVYVLYCAIGMVRFIFINCLIHACPNIERLITMTSCSISPWIYPTHNVRHWTIAPARWHYVPPNQTYSTSISCNLWHLLSLPVFFKPPDPGYATPISCTTVSLWRCI